MNETTRSGDFRICIVNSPIYSLTEVIFLDILIRILEPLTSEILVITGNFPNRYSDKVRIAEVERSKGERKRGAFTRITGFLAMQFKLAAYLMKLSRSFPVVFFYVGEYRNVLPLLCSKLMRQQTIILHQGGDKFLEAKLDAVSIWERVILPWMPRILIPLAYYLADTIICLSESIVSFGKLERYRHKIVVLPGRYVDTERFKIKVPVSERPRMVGYIGRLVPKKGIANFVKAMPLVLKECPDVEFLLIGRGVLRKEIEAQIGQSRVRDRVNSVDWVSDDRLPDYLNKLKLFVLPSMEEGVPGIIQEAMACGTPVAATPVGGIPDLIKDNKTGFVIHNNTPQGIAETVIRALNYSGLDEVARNAQSLIEREYNYETVVARYRNVLATLAGQN